MNQQKPPVVLITGASSGIGAEIARIYGQKGYRLILLARRKERLQSLAKEIEENNPSAKVFYSPCDVTHEEQVKDAVEQSLKEFGQIDITIANAGKGFGDKADQLRTEDYRNLFDTNVFGLLHTVYATLPALQKSKGRLVLIGSVLSYLSIPQSAPYCMTKFAVKALADSLRYELKASGITTTLICPGIIDSEIRRVEKNGQFNPDKKDDVPAWIRGDTHKASKQIVRAIEKRKDEKVITGHGKAVVFLQRHTPGLLKMGISAFYKA